MSCECPIAGFCKRYNRTMGARPHEICQGINISPEKAEVYRRNWLAANNPSSVLRIATDFASAVLRYSKSGFENRSEVEYNHCLDICRSCERLSIATMQCLECSCFVVLKAAMKTENCPLGKW